MQPGPGFNLERDGAVYAAVPPVMCHGAVSRPGARAHPAKKNL